MAVDMFEVYIENCFPTLVTLDFIPSIMIVKIRALVEPCKNVEFSIIDKIQEINDTSQ